MKEALAAIASAWSMAFIFFFVIEALSDNPHTLPTLILLFGAITGAGWLWFRSHR